MNKPCGFGKTQPILVINNAAKEIAGTHQVTPIELEPVFTKYL